MKRQKEHEQEQGQEQEQTRTMVDITNDPGVSLVNTLMRQVEDDRRMLLGEKCSLKTARVLAYQTRTKVHVAHLAFQAAQDAGADRNMARFFPDWRAGDGGKKGEGKGKAKR